MVGGDDLLGHNRREASAKHTPADTAPAIGQMQYSRRHPTFAALISTSQDAARAPTQTTISPLPVVTPFWHSMPATRPVTAAGTPWTRYANGTPISRSETKLLPRNEAEVVAPITGRKTMVMPASGPTAVKRRAERSAIAYRDLEESFMCPNYLPTRAACGVALYLIAMVLGYGHGRIVSNIETPSGLSITN